jgi:hypothetical protein
MQYFIYETSYPVSNDLLGFNTSNWKRWQTQLLKILWTKKNPLPKQVLVYKQNNFDHDLIKKVKRG